MTTYYELCCPGLLSVGYTSRHTMYVIDSYKYSLKYILLVIGPIGVGLVRGCEGTSHS